MNWTLIVSIAIIVGIAIVGAYKGLVKMAFSALSAIAVIILTTILAPHVSSFVRNNTQLDETVRTKTEAYLIDKEIIKETEISFDTDKILLPQKVKDQITNDAEKYINKGREEYNQFIIDTASNAIYSVAIYVGVFIVVCILVIVIYSLLKVVSKLPVLNQLNRLAGAIIGAALGLILVWILLIVFTSFGNTALSLQVAENVKNSVLLSFLYNSNPLLFVIMKVFDFWS